MLTQMHSESNERKGHDKQEFLHDFRFSPGSVLDFTTYVKTTPECRINKILPCLMLKGSMFMGKYLGIFFFF